MQGFHTEVGCFTTEIVRFRLMFAYHVEPEIATIVVYVNTVPFSTDHTIFKTTPTSAFTRAWGCVTTYNRSGGCKVIKEKTERI